MAMAAPVYQVVVVTVALPYARTVTESYASTVALPDARTVRCRTPAP